MGLINRMSRTTRIAAVAACTALLTLAIATNTVGLRMAGVSEARTPLLQRTLIFRDAPEGGIAVFDQGSSQSIEVLPREKNTFMATALRLLAGERVRRSSAGQDVPFVLTRWSDGGLSLDDPATGQSLELAAFGHTNAGTFAHLLPAKGRPQ